MKHYYSPIKEYTKIKHFHPFYKIARGITRLFFPKNEIVWKTEKPAEGEPIFYVSNHTTVYAPISFMLMKKPVRLWSNYYFLYFDTCWHHMKTRIINNHKGLWPLAFLLTPFIVMFFRSFEPIPVYHKSARVINDTFQKSIFTMEEGIDQCIFPERTENQVNRYLFQINHGFPLVAENYYEQTGKRMKFYPVYCAQNLHKLVIGEPIEYNPEIPIKTQRTDICLYLENKICEMGDSLPEHEPVLYKF